MLAGVRWNSTGAPLGAALLVLVKGEGTGAELVRVIRKITQVKKRLNEIEKEVQRVSASEMAKLRAKSEEYERRGRDLLREMAEQVERQIAAAQQEEHSPPA